MADDFVDRGAARFGEPAVVQRRRIGLTLNRRIVHNRVDLIGKRARIQEMSNENEQRAWQTA